MKKCLRLLTSSLVSPWRVSAEEALSNSSPIGKLEYFKTVFGVVKINNATSQLHKIDNSIAFLRSPVFLFVKVACLFLSLEIGSMCILFLPIFSTVVLFFQVVNLPCQQNYRCAKQKFTNLYFLLLQKKRYFTTDGKRKG